MLRGRHTPWLICAAGLAAAAALIGVSHRAFGGRSIVHISGVDSVHYFGTAHSMLFDRDFDLSNEFRRFPIQQNAWSELTATGKPASPFAIGFPLMQLPFLAIGYGVTRLEGSADTYSPTVILFYYVGLIFWTCLGLVLLHRLLRRVLATLAPDARVNEQLAAAITVGVWPATTLGYYMFSPMAHVASFVAAVIFLLAWWHARDQDSMPAWLTCGAALGLLTLCRWQDVLFAALPAVYDLAQVGQRSSATYTRWLVSRLPAVGAFLLVITPQLVQWKVLYGRWLTIPQGDDFFSFPPAHIPHVLFSTQHGWLTWTPAVALALVGSVLAWPKARALVTGALLVVALEIVLIGALRYSWSGHWSFGMRFFTALTPLLAVGLAVGLAHAGRGVRAAAAAAGVACALFTTLFAVQYRLDLIPKDDRLTWQEFASDKLRLRAAIERHRASEEVIRLTEEGHPDEAIVRAEAARARYEADRELLSAQAAAYARAGDDRRRREVDAELDRLLATRLF